MEEFCGGWTQPESEFEFENLLSVACYLGLVRSFQVVAPCHLPGFPTGLSLVGSANCSKLYLHLYFDLSADLHPVRDYHSVIVSSNSCLSCCVYLSLPACLYLFLTILRSFGYRTKLDLACPQGR